MSKRFLQNFLKRRVKIQIPVANQKTSFGEWGSEQIKKLGFLGQPLVIMKMD